MHLKFLLSAVFVCMLGSSITLLAQQAESVVPGQPQPPEVKEFQGYEDQWSSAVVKNDQYTLEFLLSPVFVNISSTGDVTTRNQQIAMLFDKGDEPVSLEQRVISVRMFGDTAVVSGTYIAKWRKDGTVHEERGIFTHVYNHDRNRWACVNAQRTAVVDLKPGKQRASKKSGASEPFHIPLFYKGALSKPAAGQTAVNSNPPN
ncbi:MAG TPA: nuclear transport factor 2 family protein [Acidobacteriaceae bacterium]|nr:nuclear transport factor 2 family protein [Acidobacteriaceae bacterium]